MKKVFTLFFVAVVAGAFFFVGSTVLAMPDGATGYCTDSGGRMEKKTRPISGSSFSVCVFPDGSECGHRDFFEKECEKGQCSRVDGYYDCSRIHDERNCSPEMYDELKNLFGDRSLIMENESDYDDLDWDSLSYYTYDYLRFCCDAGLKCHANPNYEPQPRQEPPCKQAGEAPVGVSCCEGLTTVTQDKPGQGGKCPTAPSYGSAICADCGNGLCGAGENRCNCPEDCAGDNVKQETDQDIKAAKGDSGTSIFSRFWSSLGCFFKTLFGGSCS